MEFRLGRVEEMLVVVLVQVVLLVQQTYPLIMATQLN